MANASDDFPKQKKLENLLPNFAGSSPPISPKTSPTSLWKSRVLRNDLNSEKGGIYESPLDHYVLINAGVGVSASPRPHPSKPPTPPTCHKRKRKLRCNFRNVALQKLHFNIRFSAARKSFLHQNRKTAVHWKSCVAGIGERLRGNKNKGNRPERF